MKNCCYIFLSLLLLISLSACAPDASGVKTNTCTIDSTQLVKIPMSSEMINSYKATQLIEQDGREKMVAYNDIMHGIDVIDLEQKAMTDFVRLKKEGPEKIAKVRGFYYVNKDSVFVFTDFKIFLIDMEGDFKQVIEVNSERSKINGLDFSEYVLSVNQKKGRPVYFDRNTNFLYFPLRYYRYDQNTIPEHYARENSLCGRLNINTLKFEKLDIHYPDIFREKSFGLLSSPNFLFLEDKIIYNFKTSSKIYVYDIASGRTAVKEAPSAYAPKEAEAYYGSTGAGDEQIHHVTNNPEYREFKYIPERRQYYRAVINTHPTKARRKLSYFTVLDENFNVLTDFELPPYHFPIGALPSKQGLMCYVTNVPEQATAFRVFRTQCD
ncbi:DUF4221 family protein [Phaeodactylibacter xiamenensis]|uniref:DUF4221 family protein n=1 Tax=Phaeodactylibacter xiamenensis TaxID=1524460 RepID=UPI0024A9A42A|nr:DUF4221 family protein [Phaeodactylibacter xiamenensis]